MNILQSPKLTTALTNIANLMGCANELSTESQVLLQISKISNSQVTDTAIQARKIHDLKTGSLLPSEHPQALYIIPKDGVLSLLDDTSDDARRATGAALTKLWRKDGFIEPIIDQQSLEKIYRSRTYREIDNGVDITKERCKDSITASLYVYLYGPEPKDRFSGDFSLFNSGLEICAQQHAAIVNSCPPSENVLGWEVTAKGLLELQRIQEKSTEIFDFSKLRLPKLVA